MSEFDWDTSKYIVDKEVTETNTITFHTSDDPSETPILKITDEGFWIRGVKVPQDEQEAKAVYKAFRRFMVETELKRPY
jgi:hypothetical protein